jgi:hypothetical protein
MPTSKPKRADGQVTGLAGELFVAAELLKRDHQTSVTFGNAKAIDLFAHNSKTGRTFTVQVKALRKKNFIFISHSKIEAAHIYVFVLLNKPGQAVQYFIVPGETLANKPEQFGKDFQAAKTPGIYSNTLIDLGYEDKWEVFDEELGTSDNQPA